MSLVAWYQHKADQRARMAKATVNPSKRADHKEIQRLWLEMAAEIERLPMGDAPKAH
jgi:hypothetical protein